ncbi:MAG: biopolymer transporter ExbD [Bryobacterales bacterium]|nr:biopolymer transporter ExbD [Bryobacterales bacterium]
MGITAGSNGNGGGNGGGFGSSPFGRRRRMNGAISEMNVVPLVDVVLVLLIIFMLTAHVMEFGLEVEVPRVRTVRNTSEELPVVTLTKEGEVYLSEKPVNINQLVAAIKAKYPGQQGVYVRADKNVIWEPMANVISVLGDGKLAVRMVTQPIDEAPRRGR